MNPIAPFAIVVALLLGCVLAFMLPPLLRRRAAPASAVDEGRANLALLREQLADLDAELAAGTLPAADHAAARAEIERRALDESGATAASGAARRSPLTAVALGLLVPILAVALYVRLGSPQALDPQALAAAGPVVPAEVEAMIDKLAQRMKEQPGDPEGWALLGRSYAAMQRFPDALGALSKAVALRPADAQLLADLADIMGAVHGQSLAGEPTRLIERALQADPNNVKALALAGSAAYQRRDAAAAIDFWRRARALVPDGSEFASGLDASLFEARNMAGGGAAGTPMAAAPPAAPPAAGTSLPPTTAAGPAAPPPRAGPLAAAGPGAGAGAGAGAGPGPGPGPGAGPRAGPGPAVAATGAALRGRLQLAPALAAQVRPEDTVFVYARAAEGSRMPLAILRRSAGELPFDFSLDDSMAMTPEMKLSSFGQVVVSARISRSGQAALQSGDLLGQSAPVAPGAHGLKITIDQRQP